MNLGFTGTQLGCTEPQLEGLRGQLHLLTPFDKQQQRFHHGLCIGADKQAHDIARTIGWCIIGHPPSNYSKMASCRCDEYRPEKPYLDRNRDIVDETEQLLATPATFGELQRSGTWATIRYARKLRRPIYIIWPDGRITTENVK